MSFRVSKPHFLPCLLVAAAVTASAQSPGLAKPNPGPPLPTAAPDQPIDGAWQGSLSVGAIKLRLVFHIASTAESLSATMDSPDQGMNGLAATSVTRNGGSVTIQVKRIGAIFQGTLSGDANTLDGSWSQSGQSFPLTLKRAADAAALEPRRPQNPVRPYPYREEDVSYTNPLQHDTLAATLTIPPGKGPFPAVLLITGSGPQDRDETLLGHKPFLVLSDYLTRHGILVLRADDRGVGKSTGDFSTATTADFATDVEAGIAFLKSRPEADPHRIGLIGHSEGAVIAPMVAARNHDVGFIVMLAGTGVPGAEVIAEQTLLIAEAMGVPKEKAEHDAATERELLALVVNQKDDAVLQSQLREKLAAQVPAAQIGAQVKSLTSPWFRFFLTYDPAVALRQVKCPVLALNGSKDLQVAPAQNLPAIRKALTEGGNRHVEIDELTGLNHLFQTANTGSPSEYAAIEETIAPVVLEKISTWILGLQ